MMLLHGLRGRPSSEDNFLKTLSTDVSEGMALVAPYLALLPEVLVRVPTLFARFSTRCAM
jgi:hypothetical protein